MATSTDLPWLKIYPANWLTETLGLSLAAKGALWQLICVSWSRGPLPTDEEQLRRLAGADPADWPSLWAEIRSHWTAGDAGLVNGMVEDERADATRRREIAAKGAAVTNATRHAARANGAGAVAAASAGAVAKDVALLPLTSETSETSEASPLPLTQERAGKRRSARARESCPEFEELKRIYPKRAGDSRWREAYAHCLALVDAGRSWQQLHADAGRYTRYAAAAGHTRTKFVMTAARFFDPDGGPFAEEWNTDADMALNALARTPEQIAADRQLQARVQASREKAERDGAARLAALAQRTN